MKIFKKLRVFLISRHSNYEYQSLFSKIDFRGRAHVHRRLRGAASFPFTMQVLQSIRSHRSTNSFLICCDIKKGAVQEVIANSSKDSLFCERFDFRFFLSVVFLFYAFIIRASCLKSYPIINKPHSVPTFSFPRR